VVVGDESSESAPYEGDWVLNNKGIFFDNFLEMMEVNSLTRKAAGFIHPKLKMKRNKNDQLNICLQGPLGYQKELELTLNPDKCDDFNLFGADVHTCAVETFTRVRL